MAADDLVVIGQVTRPHGVRGEVRVVPYTHSAASFDLFDQVYVRRRDRWEGILRISGVRPHKSLILLNFKGITTRDQAAELSSALLLVRREWLPEPEEGEYYWTDLIGLAVFDRQGGPLGRVEAILPTGGGEVLVLKAEGRELLLPFNEDSILEVDLDGGRLVADPPPGLLELYRSD
ncbi:MAG: ribosome maturation factor RimM [Thermodesulfobacteriota bacterium]